MNHELHDALNGVVNCQQKLRELRKQEKKVMTELDNYISKWFNIVSKFLTPNRMLNDCDKTKKEFKKGG